MVSLPLDFTHFLHFFSQRITGNVAEQLYPNEMVTRTALAQSSKHIALENIKFISVSEKRRIV